MSKIAILQKPSVLGKTIEELKDAISELGMPGFVAKQLLDWLYVKHVSSFDQMLNISKANREKLAAAFDLSPFESVSSFPSSDGSAIKYLFQVAPHQIVEAVVLQEKDYKTLCISSQCGCPVDCKFCLTGVAGFKANLTTEHILGQLYTVMAEGHKIKNLVFMGMGEPLLNYDQVIPAIHWITSPDGFGISKRNITVSTVGYLPGIKRLIKDEIPLNLAFSVGHPDPKKRQDMMPIEKRYSILDVSRTLHQYLRMHNRKLTLEYTLLLGVNDKVQDATDLAQLATYLDAKVNLINLNPHPRIPYEPVSHQSLMSFKSAVMKEGVPVTVRYTKGQDIVAACGQLGESIL